MNIECTDRTEEGHAADLHYLSLWSAPFSKKRFQKSEWSPRWKWSISLWPPAATIWSLLAGFDWTYIDGQIYDESFFPFLDDVLPAPLQLKLFWLGPALTYSFWFRTIDFYQREAYYKREKDHFDLFRCYQISQLSDRPMPTSILAVARSLGSLYRSI